MKERQETEASARAAQVYAEMLGMICHKEYIQYKQDQTVHPPHSVIIILTRIAGLRGPFRRLHGFYLLGHLHFRVP